MIEKFADGELRARGGWQKVPWRERQGGKHSQWRDGSCVGCLLGPRERVIGYNFCGRANRIRQRCVCVTSGTRVARERKGGEALAGTGEESPQGNNRCELLTGAAVRALRVTPTGEINRPAAIVAEKGQVSAPVPSKPDM